MRTATALTSPTVHLNGTSRRYLVQHLAEAARAIGDALDKMARAAPHGRDYYVQEHGALERAIAEHRSRCAKLRQVEGELTAIAVAVQSQAR